MYHHAAIPIITQNCWLHIASTSPSLYIPLYTHHNADSVSVCLISTYVYMYMHIYIYMMFICIYIYIHTYTYILYMYISTAYVYIYIIIDIISISYILGIPLHDCSRIRFRIIPPRRRWCARPVASGSSGMGLKWELILKEMKVIHHLYNPTMATIHHGKTMGKWRFIVVNDVK